MLKMAMKGNPNWIPIYDTGEDESAEGADGVTEIDFDDAEAEVFTPEEITYDDDEGEEFDGDAILAARKALKDACARAAIETSEKAADFEYCSAAAGAVLAIVPPVAPAGGAIAAVCGAGAAYQTHLGAAYSTCVLDPPRDDFHRITRFNVIRMRAPRNMPRVGYRIFGCARSALHTGRAIEAFTLSMERLQGAMALKKSDNRRNRFILAQAAAMSFNARWAAFHTSRLCSASSTLNLAKLDYGLPISEIQSIGKNAFIAAARKTKSNSKNTFSRTRSPRTLEIMNNHYDEMIEALRSERITPSGIAQAIAQLSKMEMPAAAAAGEAFMGMSNSIRALKSKT
jgi:hypothetical protein